MVKELAGTMGDDKRQQLWDGKVVSKNIRMADPIKGRTGGTASELGRILSRHSIIRQRNIRVKNQRRQTVSNLGRTEKIEEAFESATRKLKRALFAAQYGKQSQAFARAIQSGAKTIGIFRNCGRYISQQNPSLAYLRTRRTRKGRLGWLPFRCSGF